jgi:two-component SAPR family response regulator
MGLKDMRVVAVDDEAMNLEAFQLETEGMDGIEIVGMFQNPGEAFEFIQKESVDVAVLDVEMPDMNGIELGHKLRENCPEIALIYITGYKEYAYDAFQLEASAYLTKPFGREDIEKAIARARILASGQSPKKEQHQVVIRTFGRFEVFLDDKPMEFSSSKAKELLALLVDRKGGIVSTEEMLTYLWEDKPDNDKSRNLCRKVVQRLHNQLEEYGIDDIILRHNRGRSLDVSKVMCDYYQYLDGNGEGRTEFRGEYMTNYSWAEETLATLL